MSLMSQKKPSLNHSTAHLCRPDIRALAPQIRVVDGQIVVDQQSLTASAQASNPVVSQHYQRVEESGSRLNSNTYLNRKPTKRWTDADTVVFYKVRYPQYLFSGCEVCCGLGVVGPSSGRPLTFRRAHRCTKNRFLGGEAVFLRRIFRGEE